MNIKLLSAVAVACAMVGCASTPQPNAALESARTNVQRAEADPKVAQFAPLDLDAAKKELADAETAYIHRDMHAIDQPAYLASQTANLALLHAAAKADDARVAAGQKEREQIALAARDREAQTAEMERQAAAAKAAALQSQVDALKAKRSQ